MKRLSAAAGDELLATLFSVSSKHDTRSSEPVTFKEPITSASTASVESSSLCGCTVLHPCELHMHTVV